MAVLFGSDDILSTKTQTGEREEVILAGVWKTADQNFASEEEFTASMEELEELARACLMECVCTVTQKLQQADKALYVHQGKANEIAELAQNMEVSRVIFNDTLSPSQIRNLQKLLKVPVTDRTRLILEIFERRARTREAKLQVELAKLQYLKPRLSGLWQTQTRQGGASGSMSSRGEGEKQLEIDRRTIDHRLSELRRELKVVGREREIQRKKRTASRIPHVALVGYTNAGKSTIMNAMIDRWMPEGSSDGKSKKVFAEDMLFATLDTSVRRIMPEKGREFLLSDTVGFIRDLPTALVEAFHSTLEEVTQASVLLQVVDASDPHSEEQIRTTLDTIASLGAGHIPMITVFNKCDLSGSPAASAGSGITAAPGTSAWSQAAVSGPGRYPRRGMKEGDAGGVTNERVYISARDPASIELLTEVILEKLESGNTVETFQIPYQKGAVQAYLTEHARILSLEYRNDGVLLTADCTKTVAKRARKML